MAAALGCELSDSAMRRVAPVTASAGGVPRARHASQDSFALAPGFSRSVIAKSGTVADRRPCPLVAAGMPPGVPVTHGPL
jgi:hypothetical protein